MPPPWPRFSWKPCRTAAVPGPRGCAFPLPLPASARTKPPPRASETPLAVTISDDGSGIADPAVLLSFGENGWDDALVRREDAAGFGFASLARRNCAVSSRPRSTGGELAPGWQVSLSPDHFLGEAEAEVHADEEAPYPHGTSISFQATECAASIRNAAENAARHYPLPVIFEDCTEDGTAGPEELPRRAFLDGAVHAEPWRGLVFGVFRSRHTGYRDPDVNFFGLTLTIGLPTVETVHGATWTVLADVDGCPDLELVLPPRKEAVENAFLKEMREAARLAIYRAMAADPDPRPAFEDWTRARQAGIAIVPPPPVLRPWRPRSPMSTTGAIRRSSPPWAGMRWSWTATPIRRKPRRCGAPPNATASRRACSRRTAGSTATAGTTASAGRPASPSR